MTTAFEYQSRAQRVLFGRGRAADQLRQLIEQSQASRVMLVASERGRATADLIAPAEVIAGHWSEVVQHVPRHIAEAAADHASTLSADLIVSVGGGSATGTAKAIALFTGIRVVSVPTTFSGSEATDIWGMTADGTKTTGRDPVVHPWGVVYDPALLDGLPDDLAVVSAVNALAHAVDALWAPGANPVAAALAEDGIRLLAGGLTGLRSPHERSAAIDRALAGVYLASAAFSSAGSGLHHKICHLLGGRFDLPHAETHAAVLPHVVELNVAGSPDAEARIARALGSESASRGLAELYAAAQVPARVAAGGLSAHDLAEAVDLVLDVVPPSNPVPVTPEAVARILRGALATG